MASSVNLNPVAGLSQRGTNGVSSETAIARLKQDGSNELPSAQSRNILSIAWDSVQDPIFLFLVIGYLVIGFPLDK